MKICHVSGEETFYAENKLLREWAGKKHFVSLKLEYQSVVRTRDLQHPKQAALTTAPGPPLCFDKWE